MQDNQISNILCQSYFCDFFVARLICVNLYSNCTYRYLKSDKDNKDQLGGICLINKHKVLNKTYAYLVQLFFSCFYAIKHLLIYEITRAVNRNAIMNIILQSLLRSKKRYHSCFKRSFVLSSTLITITKHYIVLMVHKPQM